MPGTQPPPHGTTRRYRSPQYKCRCDACRAAARDYVRAYRRTGRSTEPRSSGCVPGLGWPRAGEDLPGVPDRNWRN